MFREINILRIFFEEPAREFNVREAAKILKVSPATASKDLKEMTKKGFLKARKQSVFDFYKADTDSDAYRDLKVYYNIRKVKESGLLDALNKFYLKPAVVLFGSAASGLDTETSDIDILVVSERGQDFPESKAFEKKLNRRLQFFVVKEVKDLRNEHLINNVVNGITLQGAVKWI